MGELISRVIGVSAGLLFAVLWVFVLFLGAGLPIMAFVVMRNITKIRVQLERLNDTLETRGNNGPGNILGL